VSVPLRVVVDPSSVEVTPGGPVVTLSVRIYNASAIVDEFVAQAVGTGEWLDAPAHRVRLFPETDQVVQFQLSTPPGRLVPAGPRTIGIKVTSATDPANARVERVQVSVREVIAEESMHVEPQIVRGGDVGDFHATIRNRGNAPLNLTLTGQDAEDLCTVDFNPRTLQLPPGGEAQVWIRVTGKRPSRGADRQRALTFRAEGAHVPLSASATFIQTPRYTRGKMLLARIAFTLAGAAAMVLGSLLDWVRSIPGLRLGWRAYIDLAFSHPSKLPVALGSGPASALRSVGLVALVLGVVAGLGLFTRKGRLTRAAGALGLLGVGAFVVTVLRASGAPPVGVGAWVALAGAIIALAGGIFALFAKLV